MIGKIRTSWPDQETLSLLSSCNVMCLWGETPRDPCGMTTSCFESKPLSFENYEAKAPYAIIMDPCILRWDAPGHFDTETIFRGV